MKIDAVEERVISEMSENKTIDHVIANERK
jgi:hypothetical protein